MKYTDLKKQFAQDITDFPIAFAFSNQQLEQAKTKLGVTDTNDMVSLGGGGFMLEKDVQAYKDMLERHSKMRQEFLSDDDNLADALSYELGNHEYVVTYDCSDALAALGLSDTNEQVQRVLPKAIKNYLSQVEY